MPYPVHSEHSPWWDIVYLGGGLLRTLSPIIRSSFTHWLSLETGTVPGTPSSKCVNKLLAKEAERVLRIHSKKAKPRHKF